jgi:UDP-N-acetylglucosamine--N-acetylmuramyl-(pentapeptide) pyrophosphoryl-undecaprenol N-acetylglucosamine transferase
MVSDADLSPEWIRDMLVPILLDPDLVAAMSHSAAEMGARESDEWLAAEVLDVMESQR